MGEFLKIPENHSCKAKFPTEEGQTQEITYKTLNQDIVPDVSSHQDLRKLFVNPSNQKNKEY